MSIRKSGGDKRDGLIYHFPPLKLTPRLVSINGGGFARRLRPRVDQSNDESSKFVQLGAVGDDLPEQPLLAPGRKVNPVLASFTIVAEDIHGQRNRPLSKPDEPAPVLLIRLDALVSLLDGGQKQVDKGISTVAAVVEILLGVLRLDTLCDL